jgi:hypothetical protein
MSLTTYDLWTFRDAVEYVLDGQQKGNQSERSARAARKAVFEAYRDIANVRDWRCFRRNLKITTVAPYSTGTIAYDYTGGAYERMLTLTTGTWPTNARHYKIRIAGVTYEVEDRKSGSIITLRERSCPEADIASGTSYSLFRDLYPLPDDFTQIASPLIEVENDRQLTYCADPSVLLQESEWLGSTQDPYLFTITQSPHFTGGLAILFSPPPNAARNYVATYKARPRPLRTEMYQQGTISMDSAGTTATGVGTTFTSAMAGAVLRASSNGTNPPTNVLGDLDGKLNPFVHQSIIKSYTSATVLELEVAAPQALSAVMFTISDPIDLEGGAMFTYFLRLCEARYARIVGKDATALEAAAVRELGQAAFADLRHPLPEWTPDPNLSLPHMADEVGEDA